MPTKQAKRILSITINRREDNFADTSWLGDYSNTRASEFSIDRAHSEGCASVQDRTTECDWDESGDMRHGKYRYFTPASVEPFDPEEQWIEDGARGNPLARKNYWRKAMRENARRDYERMEALNNGEWNFIGIMAFAEIGLPNGFPNGYLTQIITSSGCGGIESDSDESYLKEVETNELADLRGQLHALGFSKRAIAAAVKAVKH